MMRLISALLLKAVNINVHVRFSISPVLLEKIYIAIFLCASIIQDKKGSLLAGIHLSTLFLCLSQAQE